MPIELYKLPGCPYCEKVENELDDLGLNYVEHEVPADHDQRDEVAQLSDQTGVPVLVDAEHGVTGMPESDDIVEYLRDTYA